MSGEAGARGHLDTSSELSLLSFAARLLLSQLDRRLLVERGLESFLDFARGSAGAVFLLDATGERLELAVALGCAVGDAGAAEAPRAKASPWSEALGDRLPRTFPLGAWNGAPAPAAASAASPAASACACRWSATPTACSAPSPSIATRRIRSKRGGSRA